jgi:Arc/MetJ-type ribon-helix-helix transcriptional regulator
MAQRAIRFSGTTDQGIRRAVEKRGFSSPTAFIRHAVERELSGHQEELASAEERLAASIEQVRQAVLPLARAQQALFALVDSLAKILLTCIPEPDGHMLEAAVARAQGRHARLLKSAGQAMGGDSRLAMQDLVKHGER